MPRLRLIFLFFLFSLAFAHNGYNQLLWQAQWGAYTATILEDFHVSPREARGRLFVQLSNAKQPAPADTEVSVTVSYEDELVYKDALPYLTNGSSDGQTFYRAYYLDVPLIEAGAYTLELTAAGSLGETTASYLVKTQGGVSWPEYLPSSLILLVTLGGTALLFVPVKRKDTSHETTPPETPVTRTKPR